MLTLRPLEPNDIDDLLALENEPSLWDVTTEHGPYTREQLIDFLFQTTGNIETDGQLRLLVSLDNHTIGAIDFVQYNPSLLQAEVSIGLLPAYRQQGYGSKALQQAIVYAQQQLHLQQLTATCQSDNQISQALFRKHHFLQYQENKDSNLCFFFLELDKKSE